MSKYADTRDPAKIADSEEIERLTQAFLAAGGQIQQPGIIAREVNHDSRKDAQGRIQFVIAPAKKRHRR